jgi:Sigma 54 modulation protein / S30EA ribosomal protein
MKVQFHSPDQDGARWRGATQRELKSVLRRLQSLVRRVRVRLEDVNGSLPGVDKRCRVRAELPDGGVARVDTTCRTWQAAVEVAARRLRQQLITHLQRQAVTARRGTTTLRKIDGPRRLTLHRAHG